ncbi:MAG TPA: CocE/NonD family hydrolase [Gemmatimonadales bacterium]|nr:CocE/NonD family hydrolase [Gemmatimonadales bacterium]
MRARDGIKLVSDLYLPADSGRWPAILVRTPYLRTFNDGLFAKHGRTFAAKGYAYVVQDVRGRGDSEGEFDFFFQEGKDGYDAVEWIARQPWSNGRVCTMGVSYMGTVQWLAAREKPPHLVCAVPTAAAGRWGEELPWMGGVFLHTFSLRFLNDLSGRYSQGATAAGSDWDRIIAHRPLLSADSVLGRRIRLYREWASHPVIDAYWKRILFTETTFKSLDIPTLTVTGLYDGDQPGALFYWRGMQANSPARDRQWLVLGPWNHVQTYAGGVEKLQGMELGKESIIDNLQEHLAFFDVFLKRTRPSYDKPRARVFVTGSNRWREFPSYPVPGAEERSLYLHSGGRANSRGGDGTLSWTAPNDESPDAYNYDPANPVPLSEEDLAGPGEGTRTIDSRPDVLVYSTAALTEPVEVIGSVVVKLIASSDGKDTDFTATLLDVAPDGMILRIGLLPGIRRARARKGNDRVVFLTPGVADTIPIQLFDVAHTFRSGHRIRLEVSSSAAPLFAPNPNTGLPIATDTTSRVARNTVYHDRARASQVILPVIK